VSTALGMPLPPLSCRLRRPVALFHHLTVQLWPLQPGALLRGRSSEVLSPVAVSKRSPHPTTHKKAQLTKLPSVPVLLRGGVRGSCDLSYSIMPYATPLSEDAWEQCYLQ
jgi:hypothetical protein